MVYFEKTAQALGMTLQEYCQYLLYRVDTLERKLMLDKCNFNAIAKVCNKKAMNIEVNLN